MSDAELENLKKKYLNTCLRDVMNIISKYELEHLDPKIQMAIIEAWQAGAKIAIESL